MAFLKWHDAPLARDVLQGKTYQFTGDKWGVVSDEMLKRKVLAFYRAHDGKYSANAINKLVDLIIISLKEMPLENPDLIGFQNGVLNKKTGQFLAHDREHFLRFIDPFDCDISTTNTPYFDDWLDFVSHSDEQKQKVILAALFMVLTNKHEWQLFIEATGAGGAGKSIFGELATILNGRGNTAIIDLKSFESDKGRAILLGKTLAYSPDQKPYKGTADDLKAMTGGDPIKIKLLYRDEIEIKVNAVFLMSTNYTITFTDRNGGIARRRVIIYFERKIPSEKRDPNFLDKVKREIYGIVQKLLATFPDSEQARAILERHQQQGEGVEVKRQSNHLIDFASAFIVKSEPVARGLYWGSAKSTHTKENALYPFYLRYCESQNHKQTLPLQAFKQALPDALKEAGQSAALKENLFNGYRCTNVYWKDKGQTLKEWDS